MGTHETYWKRIEGRQNTKDIARDVMAARESSPVTLQIPQTGQQLHMERSYIQPETRASITVSYMSQDLFSVLDLSVWLGAAFWVLLFAYAVRKLKPWVEVLLIALYLAFEVLLDLYSAELARDFLRSGLAVLLILGFVRIARRLKRSLLS